MKATGYLIVPAGPGVRLHEVEPVAEGFATVAEAHAHIQREGLTRVQVIAECRRWLTDAEFLQLNVAIVGERAAA